MFPEGNDRWSASFLPHDARPLSSTRCSAGPIVRRPGARPPQEGRGRGRRERRTARRQAHHRPSDRARRRRQAQAQAPTSPGSQTLAGEHRRRAAPTTLDEPGWATTVLAVRRSRADSRRQARSRSTSIPSVGGSVPGTSSSRARPSHPRTGPATLPTRSIGSTTSPRWDSTSSTSRRSTRSASSIARVATTPSRRRPTTSAAHGASPTTSPSIPTSAPSTTCTRSSPHVTRRGLELALDIAFQCTPDHPWVTEHPEWFVTRADGSIQYAENPPKKYQDIYPDQLRDRRLAGAVGGAGRGVPVLDRAGRHDLPGRQPAHQGVPVLGVGDRHDPRASIRRRSSSPRRSPARG